VKNLNLVLKKSKKFIKLVILILAIFISDVIFAAGIEIGFNGSYGILAQNKTLSLDFDYLHKSRKDRQGFTFGLSFSKTFHEEVFAIIGGSSGFNEQTLTIRKSAISIGYMLFPYKVKFKYGNMRYGDHYLSFDAGRGRSFNLALIQAFSFKTAGVNRAYFFGEGEILLSNERPCLSSSECDISSTYEYPLKSFTILLGVGFGGAHYFR
jgi:hypothetical protein